MVPCLTLVGTRIGSRTGLLSAFFLPISIPMGDGQVAMQIGQGAPGEVAVGLEHMGYVLASVINAVPAHPFTGVAGTLCPAPG